MKQIIVLSRRSFVIRGAAAGAALAALPAFIQSASAESNGWEQDMMKAVGATEAAEGGVTLDLPEIAENGNTVPFGVSVDTAQAGDDRATEVHIYATGNPRAGVGSFFFTEQSGKAEVSSRMRLGKTQDVVAVAKMANGDLRMTRATVKVTIGGCGG